MMTLTARWRDGLWLRWTDGQLSGAPNLVERMRSVKGVYRAMPTGPLVETSEWPRSDLAFMAAAEMLRAEGCSTIETETVVFPPLPDGVVA
jgi:hypothetical protein